jgi:hypothetical protein
VPLTTNEYETEPHRGFLVVNKVFSMVKVIPDLKLYDYGVSIKFGVNAVGVLQPPTTYILKVETA